MKHSPLDMWGGPVCRRHWWNVCSSKYVHRKIAEVKFCVFRWRLKLISWLAMSVRQWRPSAQCLVGSCGEWMLILIVKIWPSWFPRLYRVECLVFKPFASVIAAVELHWSVNSELETKYVDVTRNITVVVDGNGCWWCICARRLNLVMKDTVSY
jgi:hypothetical protein